jgi:hypothetical protein
VRRPPAVTVIAWIFVLVGAAGMLGDLWPLLTPGAAQQLAKLKADGLADLGPAWTLRLAAIAGGLWLLEGHNWARWLLVAWMVIHIGISAFHSWQEALLHTAIFLPILYVLFRGPSGAYFRSPRGTAA